MSDEPDARLGSEAESDDWEYSNTEGNNGPEEPKTDLHTPRGSADTANRWKYIIEWLAPHPSDDPGEGRIGFVSTYAEAHALVIGLAIGIAIPAAGLVEALAALLGGGAVGSRFQKSVPKKYIDQARTELPHLIVGIIAGYLASGYYTGALTLGSLPI